MNTRHATVPTSAAATPAALVTATAPASIGPSSPGPMDASFIERNQIVERYLSGKLPPRGAQDFENFCRANPGELDAIGLAARVNAGLRLLEVGGTPPPWAERKRAFHEKPAVFAAVAAAAVALLVTCASLLLGQGEKTDEIARLKQELQTRPLLPSTNTRTVVVEPSRTAPSSRAALSLAGGTSAEFVDMKVDVSWSAFSNFRVTIDRIEQGRVAVLGNLQRDSNGHLRIGLNSTALGPGDYQMTIEGLDWRGNAQAQAWVTIAVVR
jgi:hypothetical protein